MTHCLPRSTALIHVKVPKLLARRVINVAELLGVMLTPHISILDHYNEKQVSGLVRDGNPPFGSKSEDLVYVPDGLLFARREKTFA